MCADWRAHGLQINAIAPGYFRTPLNQALVDDPDFSRWLEKRTPAGRWGELPRAHRRRHLPRLPASSFVNGHTLMVDGGIINEFVRALAARRGKRLQHAIGKILCMASMVIDAATPLACSAMAIRRACPRAGR